jgi:hypothetical protein
MSMHSAEEVDRAAQELLDRLGRTGAADYLKERLERLAGEGDWRSHDAAARVLSALERAAASPPGLADSGGKATLEQQEAPQADA